MGLGRLIIEMQRLSSLYPYVLGLESEVPKGGEGHFERYNNLAEELNRRETDYSYISWDNLEQI